jgi:hypothetical protein
VIRFVDEISVTDEMKHISFVLRKMLKLKGRQLSPSKKEP